MGSGSGVRLVVVHLKEALVWADETCAGFSTQVMANTFHRTLYHLRRNMVTHFPAKLFFAHPRE